MKPRYFEKRPKNLPKKYDSWLEHDLHNSALIGSKHHVAKEDLLPYFVEHTYEPDFIVEKDSKMYVIECKGRFRDSLEKAKYIWINKSLKDWDLFKESSCSDIELIFLFQKASTPTPFAKARKDGTKMTHGEWATKNGFKWLCSSQHSLYSMESSDQLIDLIEGTKK